MGSLSKNKFQSHRLSFYKVCIMLLTFDEGIVHKCLFQVKPWSWLETKQSHSNAVDVFDLLWLNIFAGAIVKQCELKGRQLEKWE